MSEKKTVLSKVTKTLLKNVIRHTDTHNRIVEESEMWRQRNKEMDSRSSGNSFLKDRGLDMNYEFNSRSKCQAHMDEEPRSTYWMKQLYKAEEADSNRWGHSGFKQLYPEHFEDSSSSSSDDSYHRHRNRHKQHISSRDKRERKKDRSHRKRKHISSDSEWDSDAERDTKKGTEWDSDSEQKPKKAKKKHKHKHKKRKKKHKKKEKRQVSESDSG